MNGKGDRNRTTNRRDYRANYKQVDWHRQRLAMNYPVIVPSCIPPGHYIVTYMHQDGYAGVTSAMDLAMARQEATAGAERYGVDAVIEGIGPEAGFKEVVHP
jgi:hypothetical protein